MENKWKEIPGYSRYLVDEWGNGLVKETNEPIKWHRSNGYVFATLVNDDGMRGSVGQHRVVALAFLKKPNVFERITVNHIDGVKYNNHFSNLEWSTYSSNIIHAYKTGLRKDRIPVIATHVKSGKQYEFFSKGECARFFGTCASKLTELSYGDRKCARYKDYRLRFLIEDSEWTGENPYPLGVTARRISDGHVYVAEDMTNLGRLTGVCPKVIKRVLTGKRFQYPVNGFDFRIVGSFDNWPCYTEEEIAAYKDICFIYQPVRVHFPDGSNTLVGSVMRASELTGSTERTIRYRLKDSKPCKNGFCYEKFTREIIVNS